MCVGNISEAAQYIVVAVQNVKMFTTLCPNDSSFKSDRLLFAHIPSPGYPEQISPYFLLKLLTLTRYDEHWSLYYFMLIKFINNRYCSEFLHIPHFWIPFLKF